MLICKKPPVLNKVPRKILGAMVIAWCVLLVPVAKNQAVAQTIPSPLMITEVMYDPAGEDTVSIAGRARSRQWIELYNQSDSPVEIIGGIGEEVWTFVDSTGTHFFAKAPIQGSLVIAPQEYFVLAGDGYVFLQEYPWYTGTIIDVRMELQHQYDFIQIKNSQGDIMAQALWSYNIGGQGNGKTLEFYGADDVRESTLVGGTPGKPNIPQSQTPVIPSPSPIVPKETITTEPYPRPLSIGKVIINELFPKTNNQPGWVELRNLEPYPIDIQGWKIQTLEQSLVIPTTTIINAYGFAAINAVQPSPSGDDARLFDPHGTLLFEVEYQTPVPPSWSVARFPAGWAITTTPTRSVENSFMPPESPVKSPIITETHSTAYPTSTLLSQLVSPELPILYALMTAFSGAIIFILVKRKVTW